MKKMNLWTTTFTLTLGGVLMLSACSGSEDEDEGGATGGAVGDGDGDGDTGGSPATGGGGGAPSGTGGSSSRTPVEFSFDSDVEGLVIDFEENFPGGMGGAFNSSVEFDGTDGNPAGSVELTIPFDYTGDGGFESLQKTHVVVTTDPAEDLSAAAASVDVKLVSGGTEECPINAKMFVKDSDFVWADGGAESLVEGAWVTLDVEPADPSYTDPPGNDPADIIIAGVEITPNTGDGCVTGETVVLIDNFSL